MKKSVYNLKTTTYILLYINLPIKVLDEKHLFTTTYIKKNVF